MYPKDRIIKPLDQNHNPRVFIRSVESVIELCNENQEILKYGLNIVVNEKKSRRLRKEDPDARDWSTMEEIKGGNPDQQPTEEDICRD